MAGRWSRRSAHGARRRAPAPRAPRPAAGRWRPPGRRRARRGRPRRARCRAPGPDAPPTSSAPSRPRPRHRCASKAANTSGVRTATRGARASRMAVDAAEWRDPLPAPSTSAGRPTRKNGTSEPTDAAAAWRRWGRRARRPRRRGRRRRRPRRPTSRHRALPRPGCASRAGRRAAASRAGPVPSDDGPRGVDRPKHEVLLDGPGVEADHVAGYRGQRGRPARREHVMQRERHEHRVQVVEAVIAPPDDRERQIDGRRQPDDRGLVGGVGHERR